MADKGQAPQELIRRRITVEIKRLELMIEQQELEQMEMQERISKIQENIDASKGEIEKQKVNLTALDGSMNG
jgi:ABC-type phosphate transport system auxiliary subunit